MPVGFRLDISVGPHAAIVAQYVAQLTKGEILPTLRRSAPSLLSALSPRTPIPMRRSISLKTA